MKRLPTERNLHKLYSVNGIKKFFIDSLKFNSNSLDIFSLKLNASVVGEKKLF